MVGGIVKGGVQAENGVGLSWASVVHERGWHQGRLVNTNGGVPYYHLYFHLCPPFSPFL